MKNDSNHKSFHHMFNKLIERIGSNHRIGLKTGTGSALFVDLNEIDWIQSKGKHTHFHVGTESYRVGETLNTLERKLDPAQFVRIHRSAIVNVNRIRELKTWLRGEYHVILQNGTQLLWSRRYKDRLNTFLERSSESN
jgi:two-component system, LytTR family, response regulator